jgi:peptidoglycan/xylan/chitin deacetylase (PgdA/CDA1 family)
MLAALRPLSAEWSMPPLMRATVGLHAIAAGAAIAAPQAWPWVLGGLALDHAVVTAAVFRPRSRWLGPNLAHLGAAAAARGEVAITIDDGPDPELTPAVLDLLDAWNARATFFCIAGRARAHPALTRSIVERGHSVQNHTHAHRYTFALLGPGAIERELRQAQDALADITGQRPTCFRAPAGLRNPFLDPVLHRLGLRLVSWTRRGYDTRDADAARVARRLTRGLAGGDILLLHDGRTPGATTPGAVLLEVLPALLASLRDAGLHAVTVPQGLAAGDREEPSAAAVRAPAAA